jgi:hypothetical protein
MLNAKRDSFSINEGDSNPKRLSATPRTTQANVGSDTASAA